MNRPVFVSRYEEKTDVVLALLGNHRPRGRVGGAELFEDNEINSLAESVRAKVSIFQKRIKNSYLESLSFIERRKPARINLSK